MSSGWGGGHKGGSYIRDCKLGFSGLPEAVLDEPPRIQCSEFIFLTYGTAGSPQLLK